MNQDQNAAQNSSGSFSLTYDTDEISIAAIFDDEMSAYRGRRAWADILSAHFLLENKRDFALAIDKSPDLEKQFRLRCEFDSACGRYAFWRLINHQATEAEDKLLKAGYPEHDEKTLINIITAGEGGPWILSSTKEGEENRSFGSKLLEIIFGRTLK